MARRPVQAISSLPIAEVRFIDVVFSRWFEEARPMRSSLILILFCAGILDPGSSAQDQPKSPSSTELEALDPLVGTWDVALQFKIGPGKMADGKASCETKWILDGLVVHQEYKSTMNGKPFTTLEWLGYDQRKQKFFEVIMNSMESAVHRNEGVLSKDGKTLTQTGTRLNPVTKKPETLRTVLTFQDRDHYILGWFLPDEQGKEERTVILRHTRKGS
jgi:hypothetical protein